MSKNKKRKPAAKPNSSNKQDIRAELFKCVRASGIVLLVLLLLLAVLSFVYLKKEVSFTTLRTLAYIFSGISFLLCGFLAVHKNKMPAVYASGAAGLLVLLILVAILAVLSGGVFGNTVWILVACGVVCPFLGGILARKF